VAVWLRADLELLWQRVRHKATRPLLRSADPRGVLAGLLDERAPVYAEAAIIVDASADYAIEAMAARVLAALEAHGGVVE
jgi:shikimate kinase